MQSSSELFPVALVSAELRGDLSEDVYRLKPGNSPDFTVELAVTRLGLAGQENRGVPVILLHGSFSNRRFWYSPRGIGLGPHLARALAVEGGEIGSAIQAGDHRAHHAGGVAMFARGWLALNDDLAAGKMQGDVKPGPTWDHFQVEHTFDGVGAA